MKVSKFGRSTSVLDPTMSGPDAHGEPFQVASGSSAEGAYLTCQQSSASSSTATIASLSIAVCVLALALAFLLVFVVLILCRWVRHSTHDPETPSSPLQNTIRDLMNYQNIRLTQGKINPVFDPDCLVEESRMQHGEERTLVTPMEPARSEEPFPGTDEIISPEHCLSGRFDRNLVELLRTDMKESVTVEVDSKLLVFMSRELDASGGHLVLDKMGISLFVPPCAIPAGRKEVIYLVLVWDLSDFPAMTDKQTIISPVVHCGPFGMKLEKQAVLSFMHCAKDPNDIMVMSSQTHLMHEKDWRVMKKQTKRGALQFSLLPNQCQVYLSHFSLFTCLAEGPETKKWIQLVAFGGSMKVGGHYQIFVYMLNNTPCALQFAAQQQAKHKCFQIRCPLEFLFDARRGDLIFKLEHLSAGWTSVGRKWEERGLVAEIWQGKCGNVSFVFNHENPLVTNLTFNMEIFQKDLEHEKRCLQVALNMPGDKPIQANQHSVSNVTNVNVKVLQDHGVAQSSIDSVAPSKNVSTVSTRGSDAFHDEAQLGKDTDSMDPDYEEECPFELEVMECCGGTASHDVEERMDNYDRHGGDKMSITNETNQLDKPGSFLSAGNDQATVRSVPSRQETSKKSSSGHSTSRSHQGQKTTIQINIVS